MPAPQSPAGRRTIQGIAWMALSGLLFVCVTAIIRNLGPVIPAVEAAFIRYAIGLMILSPVLVRTFRTWPRKERLGVFAIRGLIHGGFITLWFYAMARIPIAEVTALGYLSPIFVAIGAALFLGETLHARRIVAIAAGFVGMLVILRPGFQSVELGHMAQIAAAPLLATSLLIGKRLSRDEDPSVIVAMLSVFVTLALLPGAVALWRTPTVDQVLWLTLTAVLATSAHYCMARAFKAAPITVTQPVSFLQLVWAAAFGLLIFGESLDPFVFIGSGIVVGAATYIAHREAAAARRQSLSRG